MDGGLTQVPTVKSKLPNRGVLHKVHSQNSGNFTGAFGLHYGIGIFKNDNFNDFN